MGLLDRQSRENVGRAVPVLPGQRQSLARISGPDAEGQLVTITLTTPMLDATAGDPSFYDPESVRRFLSTLRVPLFVWSTSERPPLGAIWGGAAPIDSPRALERAVGELREVLDRQRILWVPGVLSSNRVAIRVSTN